MRVRLINYMLKLQSNPNDEKTRSKINVMLEDMKKSQRLTYQECKELKRKIEQLGRKQ